MIEHMWIVTKFLPRFSPLIQHDIETDITGIKWIALEVI